MTNMDGYPDPQEPEDDAEQPAMTELLRAILPPQYEVVEDVATDLSEVLKSHYGPDSKDGTKYFTVSADAVATLMPDYYAPGEGTGNVQLTRRYDGLEHDEYELLISGMAGRDEEPMTSLKFAEYSRSLSGSVMGSREHAADPSIAANFQSAAAHHESAMAAEQAAHRVLPELLSSVDDDGVLMATLLARAEVIRDETTAEALWKQANTTYMYQIRARTQRVRDEQLFDAESDEMNVAAEAVRDAQTWREELVVRSEALENDFYDNLLAKADGQPDMIADQIYRIIAARQEAQRAKADYEARQLDMMHGGDGVEYYDNHLYFDEPGSADRVATALADVLRNASEDDR